MVYLTDLSFHLSERPVVLFLPVAGAPVAAVPVPVMVVPVLEESKARGTPFECRLFTYDDVTGPADAFTRALEHAVLAGRRLGIEARRMRFLELDLMAHSGHAPVVEGADLVFASLRMQKDDVELAHMRRAVAIAEEAYRAALHALRPGVTERAVAAELTLQTLRAGSDSELPFAPIIAAGPNGANPHAFPTDRRLEAGDLVTVDWGASWQGYFADITRTVAIAGAPVPDALHAAYDAVQAANAAGRAAVRPGGTGQAVDRAARGAIEAVRLGAYFTHRTGHGLGLEGHEEPDMKEGSLLPLAVGMTFTVEPGVYIPGLGGVRIEDDMVVTDAGGESLTTLDRGWQVVGE